MSETRSCAGCGAVVPAELRYCGLCGADHAPATDESPARAVPVQKLPNLLAVGTEVSVNESPLREPVLDERPTSTRPRRWLLPVTIGSGLLVCAIAAGIATQAGAATSPSPVVSSSLTREVAGVPGWSTQPAWASSGSWEDVVVAAGGDRFGTLEDGAVIIRDAAGVRVDREPIDGEPVLYTGFVDGDPAILAAAGATVRVWAGDMTTSTVWDLPAGGRMAVLGAGVIITDATGLVSVLTGEGPAPFVSPLAGAAPFAFTTDGAMQWASARGAVLTASAVGTIIQQVPLAPPAPGARVTRWLAGGPSFLVEWTLPDDSITLATHSTTDGALLATTPLEQSVADGPLISAPGATVAMLGSVRVDRTTGTIETPDPGFLATKALGDSFYGATGTRTAVLTGDTVTEATQTPTIVPVGVLAGGTLLASEQGVLTIFPTTTAN